MHFKTLGTPKDSEPLFSGTLSPIETLIPGDLPQKALQDTWISKSLLLY